MGGDGGGGGDGEKEYICQQKQHTYTCIQRDRLRQCVLSFTSVGWWFETRSHGVPGSPLTPYVADDESDAAVPASSRWRQKGQKFKV